MKKKFISYYRKHLGLFTLDMLCALVIALIELSIPFIVGIIIDDAVMNRDTNLVFKFGTLLGILIIIDFIMRFIVTYYGHMMGTRIEKDMRYDLFMHFQKMDIKFFTNEKVGRLMNRLVGDLRDISEFAHHGPEDIFLSLVMLIGSFVVLFSINSLLTLLLLAILLGMMIFTVLRRHKMMDAFRETRIYQAELNSQVENSLSGMAVMKAYTNESYELNKFEESNFDFQQSWVGAYFQMGIFNSTMNFALKIITVLTVVFGGYLAINAHISYGNYASFILYVTYFTAPLKTLISFFDHLQKGYSGFERFYEMILKDDEVKSGDLSFTKFEKDISFVDASFKYEDELIFNKLSFTILKNESVALVGKTGVGKSTIAKMLPRFYDLTTGELLIDGCNIKNYKLDELRQKIGYVQQDAHIFYGTIKENILYGNVNASDDEVRVAAKLAHLDEFVESLPKKYETEVGERGLKLSGGQKQRLSLARIFLKNPDILVFDEATSALDNETEKFIQKSIAKLSENRTTLIIAHRLTTIKNVDKIYLLGDDGFIEVGSHDELMANKHEYYHLYMAALKNDELL